MKICGYKRLPPSRRKLRCVAFVEETSECWFRESGSAPAALNLVLNGHYKKREGNSCAINLVNGGISKQLDITTIDENGEALLDIAFRNDPARTIKMPFERVSRSFRNQLQIRLIEAVLRLRHARVVRECRALGHRGISKNLLSEMQSVDWDLSSPNLSHTAALTAGLRIGTHQEREI